MRRSPSSVRRRRGTNERRWSAGERIVVPLLRDRTRRQPTERLQLVPVRNESLRWHLSCAMNLRAHQIVLRKLLTAFPPERRNQHSISSKQPLFRTTMPQNRFPPRIAGSADRACGNRAVEDFRAAETAMLQRDHEERSSFARWSHRCTTARKGESARRSGARSHRAVDCLSRRTRCATPVSRRGLSVLFSYCTEALHLSEHAAYNRIEVARARHDSGP